jgi:hypothetical protein
MTRPNTTTNQNGGVVVVFRHRIGPDGTPRTNVMNNSNKTQEKNDQLWAEAVRFLDSVDHSEIAAATHRMVRALGEGRVVDLNALEIHVFACRLLIDGVYQPAPAEEDDEGWDGIMPSILTAPKERGH